MMDSADTLLASLQIGDNVPDTEGFDEIFRHIGSPDSHFEVHYTWKNGVCSRSVQIGPADDCFVTSEGSLRCVLDDPDYPYVMYLPRAMTRQTERSGLWYSSSTALANGAMIPMRF